MAEHIPMDGERYRTLVRECVEPYAPLGRMTHGYVRGKLLHDPVYQQLAQRGPFAGPLCDLGCGRGQTTLLLSKLQPELEGVGFDWDESKLSLARAAAKGAQAGRLRYVPGDLQSLDVPPSGTILMLDVLHYNPIEIQDQMLRRAAEALLPGGRLFLREVDANGSLRARINQWQERLGCWLRLNRGATLSFRSIAEIEEVLQGHGLKTRSHGSFAGTPLANVLIEASAP
ncbi:MAG: SAM-dependent methyltransferase [Candidatus Paceibacteria bacterium]|jgi:SAM-dependent methyltransferase